MAHSDMYKVLQPVKATRVATLEWPRDDDGIADYANPKVIPLAVPREEYVFPPINPKTHRVIPR